MKVTVLGANGGVGAHVVALLTAAGHDVTAVVRSSASWRPTRPGLRTHRVNRLDVPGPLREALDGRDAVISAVGPRRASDGPVASTTTAAVLDAMAQAGVDRIIVVSAAPVGESAPTDGVLLRGVLRPLIRTVFCDHYLDLARMEGLMAGSGHRWTAVRPPRLTDGSARGRYRRIIGGNVPNGFVISRADTAHAMCHALTDVATIGKPVGVAY